MFHIVNIFITSACFVLDVYYLAWFLYVVHIGFSNDVPIKQLKIGHSKCWSQLVCMKGFFGSLHPFKGRYAGATAPAAWLDLAVSVVSRLRMVHGLNKRKAKRLWFLHFPVRWQCEPSSNKLLLKLQNKNACHLARTKENKRKGAPRVLVLFRRNKEKCYSRTVSYHVFTTEAEMVALELVRQLWHCTVELVSASWYNK